MKCDLRCYGDRRGLPPTGSQEDMVNQFRGTNCPYARKRNFSLLSVVLRTLLRDNRLSSSRVPPRPSFVTIQWDPPPRPFSREVTRRSLGTEMLWAVSLSVRINFLVFVLTTFDAHAPRTPCSGGLLFSSTRSQEHVVHPEALSTCST